MLRGKIILSVVLLSPALALHAVAQVSPDDGYAITAGPAQQILSFGPPEGGPQQLSIISAKFITGLQSNEQILRISVGPSHILYALTSQAGIYTLTADGRALFFDRYGTALNGTAFGFATSSSANRGAMVSNLGQNWVLDLTSGTFALGGNLAYAPNQVGPTGIPIQGTPEIVDIAYSPGPNPQLYALDANSQMLVRITGVGNPSGGQVFTITTPTPSGDFELGNITPTSCLDFLPDGRPVYSTMEQEPDGVVGTFLNTIDLNTGGNGQFFGRIGDNGTGVELASIVVPEPISSGVVVAIMCGILFRSRTRPPSVTVA